MFKKKNKDAFYILYTSCYFYFLLGFIFHTSSDKTVLGKYSMNYFIFIVFLVFLYPVVFLIIRFCSGLTKISIGKHLFVIHPIKKIVTLIVFLVCFMSLLIPIAIKQLSQPKNKFPYSFTLKNFHPFLQTKLIKENNNDNKELHINSESFRYDEITKEKASNVYRIFVMGGSTVINATTPYEENVVRVLEKKIRSKFPDRKIQVINAGNSGYTSEHSLIQYLFHIREFYPDMIIIWQGINDMYYSCESIATSEPYKDDYSHYMGLAWPLVRKYYDEKPLLSIDVKGFDVVTNLFGFILYSDIRNFIQESKKNADPPKFRSIDTFPSIYAFERNMTYFAKIVHMDNVRLIIADQPYSYREDLPNSSQWFVGASCGEKDHIYPDNKSLIKGIESFNNISNKVALEQGSYFLNLESQIPKTDTYFTDDVHFTKEGNEIVANVIYEYLIKNSLLQ